MWKRHDLGRNRDAVDNNDSEVLSVRSGSDRGSVEHDVRVARRQGRLIAAAEEALGRARRHTSHRGIIKQLLLKPLAVILRLYDRSRLLQSVPITGTACV